MEQYQMSTVKARSHATSREAGNNYSLAPRAQESLPPHTLPLSETENHTLRRIISWY